MADTRPATRSPPSSRHRRPGAAGDPRAALITAIGSHGSARRDHVTSDPSLHHAPAPHLTARRTAEREPTRQKKRRSTRVLAYTPAVTQRREQGRRAGAHLRRRPRPLHPAARRRAQPVPRAATFFAIGEEERYFSAGSSLELRSGDVVGDHTETHPMMALALGARPARRAPRTDRPHRTARRAATRVCSDLPTARSTPPRFTLLHQLHLLMVLWSTDTSDYTLPGCPGDRAERARGRPPRRDHPDARRRRRPVGDDRGAAGDHPGPAQARTATR